MLPVSDVIPSRTTPWVTLALMAAHAIVFVYESLLTPDQVAALVARAAFVPVDAGWLTATTAMFMHENGLHVALTVAALWIFGDNVEDQLGHGRYLAFYLMAGYAGALAEVWAAPTSAVPLVGANGAVAGVIGAYLVMFPRSRVLVIVPARSLVDAVEVPALLPIGVWLVLQIAGGLGRLSEPFSGLGAVALWTTVGGLVAGALTVHAFRRRERRRVEWWGA
jgi:membrane associated rhomboid family serine protease